MHTGRLEGCVQGGISHQVCGAGTTDTLQTKIKREGTIRSSHQLDVSKSEEEPAARKTRNKYISKESHLPWQYFGVVGVRFTVLRH